MEYTKFLVSPFTLTEKAIDFALEQPFRDAAIAYEAP
jgi:hypothetical protein